MTIFLIYLALTIGTGEYITQTEEKPKILSYGEHRAISYIAGVAWFITLPRAIKSHINKENKNSE